MWWSLLIWVVVKLIEWLLTRPRLTHNQRDRVNLFLYRANEAGRVAEELGCAKYGRLPIGEEGLV